MESRHLLYLQLRKSILESQIMCNDDDLIHLGGLALQAEMGKFSIFIVLFSHKISSFLNEFNCFAMIFLFR